MQPSVFSPITQCSLSFGKRLRNQIPLFFKRDDIPRIMKGSSLCLSGNKARKYYSLGQLLASSQLPLHIRSNGGAQSNSMLALAKLAFFNKSAFTYYTRKIPKQVRLSKTGNFADAINAYGMHVIELNGSEYDTVVSTLGNAKGELYVPQGGACSLAEEGITHLVNELIQQLRQLSLSRGTPKWKVVFASGTGAC
jgi:1-aminocyclopropane-1-carboxylate deaminase/D-cysteine desulfhydrase-like pyridoxal-dependent ACC family enzyme